MPNQEKKQQGLMKIIKAIHNFTVNDDLENTDALRQTSGDCSGQSKAKHPTLNF